MSLHSTKTDWAHPLLVHTHQFEDERDTLLVRRWGRSDGGPDDRDEIDERFGTETAGGRGLGRCSSLPDLRPHWHVFGARGRTFRELRESSIGLAPDQRRMVASVRSLSRV
jgi:hypothetical protein